MTRTQDQQHFDAFGFLVQRQLLSGYEIGMIAGEFEAAMREAQEGQPFDGTKRMYISDWVRTRSEISYLELDFRIRDKIDELLGPENCLKDGNDGNYYVGDTEWHPDLGWDPSIPEGKDDPYRLGGNMTNHYKPSIKVAFYLDPVRRDSGCLRVIPGSHRNPLHDLLWSLHLDIPARAEKLDHVAPKLREMWERDTGSSAGAEQLLSDTKTNTFGVSPVDIPAHAIESEPGDVVFFSHQLWHASFGGRSGRRMFTLNFLTP